ncbi:hypothetical protein YC2023_029438 [Brassica napus]
MGKFLRLGWVAVCVIVLLMSVQVLGQAFDGDSGDIGGEVAVGLGGRVKSSRVVEFVLIFQLFLYYLLSSFEMKGDSSWDTFANLASIYAKASL